jgi:ABC-type polysaccharide/polyol phosphate transport system ATPase subunit
MIGHVRRLELIQSTNHRIASWVAVVFVSHNLKSVKVLSTRTFWLEVGTLKMFSETKAVVDAYEAF